MATATEDVLALAAEPEVAPSSSNKRTWLLGGVGAVTVAMLVTLVAVDLPREAVGGLVMASMIGLMVLGIPIAISMLIPSLIGMWKLSGAGGVSLSLQETPFNAVASWSLSVIPTFVLLGVILWKSGLTTLVYGAARAWLGRVPGGLAIGTNMAGAGLASASGSTIGITYALGRIAIPEMLKSGYKPSLATGTVAMVGTLGQIIPPSVLLVIYAGIVQTPVGPQLMAGVIPGILLAIAYGVYILVRAVLNPELAPRSVDRVSWGERFRSLYGLLPIGLVVLVVVGGMLSGVFTATESAAVGALSAAIVAPAFAKSIRAPRAYLRFISDSLIQTVASVAGLFLLLVAVTTLSKVLTLTRITHQVTQFILDLGLSRVTLLLLLVLVFLILGMFLDPLAMMLITIPVLMGPLQALDVDLIWFGIFMVIMAEVAMVTPPLGILAFIVHNLSQERSVNLGQHISLIDVFRGLIGFVVITLAFVVAFIFAPDLALWLPGQMVNN